MKKVDKKHDKLVRLWASGNLGRIANLDMDDATMRRQLKRNATMRRMHQASLDDALKTHNKWRKMVGLPVLKKFIIDK